MSKGWRIAFGLIVGILILSALACLIGAVVGLQSRRATVRERGFPPDRPGPFGGERWPGRIPMGFLFSRPWIAIAGGLFALSLLALASAALVYLLHRTRR